MSLENVDKSIRKYTDQYGLPSGIYDRNKAADAVFKECSYDDVRELAVEAIKSRIGLKSRAIENQIKADAIKISSGQLFLPHLESMFEIEDGTSKSTPKMTQHEFYAALKRQEKKAEREAEKTRWMRDAYSAFSIIWQDHPDWLVEQCDEEVARRGIFVEPVAV